jgi:hypothetical protein
VNVITFCIEIKIAKEIEMVRVLNNEAGPGFA